MQTHTHTLSRSYTLCRACGENFVAPASCLRLLVSWSLPAWFMPLLKRLQGLAKSLQNTSGGSADGVQRRPSSADFSVQQSALSRTIGWHVGRGASSGLLQQVASAALEESGASHVTASALSKMFL